MMNILETSHARIAYSYCRSPHVWRSWQAN